QKAPPGTARRKRK
nr:Chain B, Signal recognition particle 54 kDa protein, chloroplastic [Arabidopsis thaliana]